MTTTQGTLSARLGDDAFLLKPAGAGLDRIGAGQIQSRFLDPGDGEAIDPTAALHAALYRSHPQVGAIIEGVGAHTAGFCTAGVALPSRTIPESYLLVRDPVPIAHSEARHDPAAVAARLGPDSPVGLIGNRGGIALGLDPLDAFDRLEVLEATAAAVLASRRLGRVETIDDERIEALRRAFFPSGGLRLGQPED